MATPEPFHWIVWPVVAETFSLIGIPVSLLLFSRSVGTAVSFSYGLTLLVIAYVSWMLAFLGCCSLSDTLLWSITGFLFLSVALWVRGSGDVFLPLLKNGWKTAVRTKILFWAVFLVLAWVRSHVPKIYGAEKFMDFAMINSLVRESGIPPGDPWMSGETINYYYFGYLVIAVATRLTGIDSAVTYNLALALLFTLTFMGVFSLIRDLTGVSFAHPDGPVSAEGRVSQKPETKTPIPGGTWIGSAAGMAGAVLVVVVGNLDGFLQWQEKGTLFPFDYFRSSRVIEGAIDEFPYFSFLHGDLHPHVISLPYTVLAIGLMIHLFKNGMDRYRKQWPRWAALTFVLGSLYAISSWDFLTYSALLFCLTFVYTLRGTVSPDLSPGWGKKITGLLLVLGICLGAVLLFFPFPRTVHLPFRGIGLLSSSDRSAIGQWAVMWGLFWVLFILGGMIRFQSDPNLGEKIKGAGWIPYAMAGVIGTGLIFQSVVLALLMGSVFGFLFLCWNEPNSGRSDGLPVYGLVLFGLFILMGCEILYFKDVYGDSLKRMNTVFKFFIPAWVLLGLSTGALMARWIPPFVSGIPRILLARYGAVLALVFGLGLIYPAGATLQLGEFFRNPPTLDGTAYLLLEHPEDGRAIRWLKKSARGKGVVLEATGPPYGYFSRVSSNTGLSTVLGWANHESVWRGNEVDLGAREEDIRTMYTSNDAARVKDLLDRYNVGWVYVGELEYQTYPELNPDVLQSLMEPGYRDGRTLVLRRREG